MLQDMTSCNLTYMLPISDWYMFGHIKQARLVSGAHWLSSGRLLVYYQLILANFVFRSKKMSQKM